MIIRCWGARGSIPVSGANYLKYGGDTTCLEIRTSDDQIIIVDAGSGIRRLGNRLLAENRGRYVMIFTHAHWDHILGFPFFKPIYREKTHLDLYGCVSKQGSIEKLLSKTMVAPYFPVPFDQIKADIHYNGDCSLEFRIGTLSITSIALSHPNVGMGYKFTENGKTFVFLTDNELGYTHRGGRSYEDYVEFSKDADLLFHDAEYTPEEYSFTRTWGHSTYVEALNLALDAKVKSFGLFHHNQDRSDAELDTLVADCHRRIAERGSNMECFALSQDYEITL